MRRSQDNLQWIRGSKIFTLDAVAPERLAHASHGAHCAIGGANAMPKQPIALLNGLRLKSLDQREHE
jgi:hypothetical protein